MVEKEYLRRALGDLGFDVQEGELQARGFAGKRTPVELKVSTRKRGYDIGFRKAGDAYELVADWFGIPDFNQEDLLRRLNQRYAYHAARIKLEEQGFSLAGEEVQEGGQIHLLLRRSA